MFKDTSAHTHSHTHMNRFPPWHKPCRWTYWTKSIDSSLRLFSPLSRPPPSCCIFLFPTLLHLYQSSSLSTLLSFSLSVIDSPLFTSSCHRKCLLCKLLRPLLQPQIGDIENSNPSVRWEKLRSWLIQPLWIHLKGVLQPVRSGDDHIHWAKELLTEVSNQDGEQTTQCTLACALSGQVVFSNYYLSYSDFHQNTLNGFMKSYN